MSDITPPPELISQWLKEFYGPEAMPGMAAGEMVMHVATQAANWGANQELDACCEHMQHEDFHGFAKELRAARRRPKPPNLVEEALMALEDGGIGPGASLTPVEVCTIRTALERLQELEQNND